MKVCPKCGYTTASKICVKCGTPLTGNVKLDEANSRHSQNETISKSQIVIAIAVSTILLPLVVGFGGFLLEAFLFQPDVVYLGKSLFLVMLNLSLVALFFYTRNKGKLLSVATMSLLIVVIFLQGGFFLRPWWISQCLPDCPNQNLSEIDWLGHDLRGANLSGANLHGADLSETNLSGANLTRADLSSANLDETNLNGADLSGADLSGANLFGTNLSGANLSGSNFNESDLNRVILNEAKIDDTTQIDDKWRLVWEIVNQGVEGRDLSRADLSVSGLGGADMSEVNLTGADLRGANLSKAHLIKADLSGANLSGADLSGAELEGAAYNTDTIWPLSFDAEAAGAVLRDQ